ncbi:hypothetical protein BY996DRAFT_4121173 [Phakopsora pachyrhizi]|nr:hypothetical protein BY996DRAFT_4121173 [Phakopsora pachyrhizi]
MRMEIGRENLSDERLEDEPSVKNLLDYLSRLEKLSKSISEFRSSDFPKLFGTLLESNISQFTPPSEVWRSNSTQIRSDLVQIRRTLVSCQDVLEYVKTSSTIDPRVKREESHLREQSNRSNQTKGRSGTTTSQFKSDPSQIDLIKSYRVDYRSFKKLEVERKNFGFREWIEELNREIEGSKKLRLISDDFVEVKGLMRVRLLFRKTDSRIIERVACFSNNELNSKIYQQSSYELFRSISRFMNQTINRYPFNCPNLLLISVS